MNNSGKNVTCTAPVMSTGHEQPQSSYREVTLRSRVGRLQTEAMTRLISATGAEKRGDPDHGGWGHEPQEKGAMLSTDVTGS